LHIACVNPQGNFDAKDSYWTEHPDFGEQLVYVKEIAIALAALGHKVDILTRQIIDPRWPEFAAPIEHYPGIPNVNILRIPCGPKKFIPKEQLWPYLGTQWVANILNFYASAGIMPDVFSAHYADGGLVAALLSRETGKPFTFTGHSLGAQKMKNLQATPGNLADLDGRFHFLRRILAERVSMSRANRVITSTFQERRDQYGHRAYQGAIDPADESRFCVIPPGVNRRIFSPEPTDLDVIIASRIRKARKRDISKGRRKLPVVLISSHLDAKKNQVGIVRAYAQNKELQEKANLALTARSLEDPLQDYTALTPSEKDVMEKIIVILDAHNLWDNVMSFPINSQAELAAAYRVLVERRSIFTLTSMYEPFGLAPLEAMSCGLPVVATRNGGPSESMIEGDREFGVLIDPADPAEIARGLLRIIGSDEEWDKFHQAGISRVRAKYTWERAAEGYLGVIDDLREAAPPTNPIEIPPWFSHPTAKNEIPLQTLSDLYFETG
jgi:sucrose-phosphate synthase